MSKIVAPLAGMADVVAEPGSPVALDAVDIGILQLLAEDARTSQRSLARALGMSPPAVGERVARLERLGVIRGYTLDIGWPEAGFPVTVFLTITAVQGHPLAPVLKGLRELPEVTDVSLVTGAIDLLVRLVVRDHNHLRQLLFERVWPITGVQRTETMVTLAEMKPKQCAVPLLETARAALNGGVHQ
jgi:DNA-binding Lrp family transcriptional regulator